MDFFLRTRQAFVLFSLMCLTAGFVAGVVFMNSLDVPETTTPILLENETENDADTLALTPIVYVNGEVTAIGEGSFDMKILSFDDPTLPDSFFERTVKVDENTLFSTKVPIPVEEAKQMMAAFQEEMTQWQDAQENGEEVGPPPSLPTIYENKVVSLADIEVGQRVLVNTQEDIRLEKEFTAVAVDVFPPEKNI